MSIIRKRLASLAVLLLVSVFYTVAEADPYRVTSLLVPLTRYSDLASMASATVVKVVDGDTIKVEIDDPPRGIALKETVRLLGVDTPECVDRRKEVERFAKEASAHTKERLLGARIYLAFDHELRDRYGRLLAYVFLEDGSCFDLELIADGYGFAYVKYPFFFMAEFRNAELNARYGRKGLWE